MRAALLPIALAFAFAACGSPKPPIQHRIDMKTIAATPPDGRTEVGEAYKALAMARAELAHVEYLLEDISYELKLAKMEREQVESNRKMAEVREKRSRSAFKMALAKSAAKAMDSMKSNSQKEKKHMEYLKAEQSYLKKKRSYALVAVDHAEARFELAKANVVKDRNLSPKGFKHQKFVSQEQRNKKRADSKRSAMQSAKQKASSKHKAWGGQRYDTAQ